jgi:hypothetical protein
VRVKSASVPFVLVRRQNKELADVSRIQLPNAHSPHVRKVEKRIPTAEPDEVICEHVLLWRPS